RESGAEASERASLCRPPPLLFGRRTHLPRTTGAAFTPDGHRVRGHGCAPARYRHGDHRQLLEEPRDDHPARTVPLRAAGPAAAVAAPVGRWSPDPGLVCLRHALL